MNIFFKVLNWLIEDHKCINLTFNNWYNLVCYVKLPETTCARCNIIEMWPHICCYQKLSEDFIRKFQDKVDWDIISSNQTLSEDFIREFQNKVNWVNVSFYQKLSESFIREFKDKVHWNVISSHQNLSEDFIEEFKDKINMIHIAITQNVSKDFLKKFEVYGPFLSYYNYSHNTKSREQKIKEMKEYAKRNNLKFDGEYLYAYRYHDIWGRGMYNKTIFYEKGKYYRDWHCNMDPFDSVSFGLGISNFGNTKVKVSVDDWGTSYFKNARAWGFSVL